jgi:hypothetical protein
VYRDDGNVDCIGSFGRWSDGRVGEQASRDPGHAGQYEKLD